MVLSCQAVLETKTLNAQIVGITSSTPAWPKRDWSTTHSDHRHQGVELNRAAQTHRFIDRILDQLCNAKGRDHPDREMVCSHYRKQRVNVTCQEGIGQSVQQRDARRRAA
jgi:hypothetical protein